MATPAFVVLPVGEPDRELPDHLPARMVNEFVYCPRLFFYEWVEGLFRESADTVEGAAQHRRVDKPGKRGLPDAQELATVEEPLHSRSITLSSEAHRVIAKMDLIEATGSKVTPVDYKRGKPKETEHGLEVWPADRAQIAVQGLVLRENGYTVEEGVLYYQTTKQRVTVPLTDEVMAETLGWIAEAWRLARAGRIPPPLEDSPKCVGCSLAPICLPDEVNKLRRLDEREPDAEQLVLFAGGEGAAPKKDAGREIRRLMTPRDDLKPVYLDTQGLRVGKSGEVLQVKEKDRVVQEVRMREICQVNLMGNIQISTQAVQSLCEAEIPVCYFSQGGWFYGITRGMGTKNVLLRQRQFRLAQESWFCRKLAAQLTAGKIRNQRTMLLRNHLEPQQRVLVEMREMAERAAMSRSLEELLGIEGNAARLYFSSFQGFIKVDHEPGEERVGKGEPPAFSFSWEGRNRRPPQDPVNALLSLGYSMLTKDFTIACYAVGFDPMQGFYHQPRHGKPALALDLMEPFRPLVVDSAVVNAINTKMVTPKDFLRAGKTVALKPEGRKAFYRAYEARMDTLVTHPLFEYRVSYRRLLEVQARLLGKMLTGEIGEYPVFVTR